MAMVVDEGFHDAVPVEVEVEVEYVRPRTGDDAGNCLEASAGSHATKARMSDMVKIMSRPHILR